MTLRWVAPYLVGGDQSYTHIVIGGINVHTIVGVNHQFQIFLVIIQRYNQFYHVLSSTDLGTGMLLWSVIKYHE